MCLAIQMIVAAISYYLTAETIRGELHSSSTEV